MTRGAGLRWGSCLFAVVFVHCLVASALLGRHRIVMPPIPSIPIDLAPAPAAAPPSARVPPSVPVAARPAPKSVRPVLPPLRVTTPVAATATIVARAKPVVRHPRASPPHPAGVPVARPAAASASKTAVVAPHPRVGSASAPSLAAASATWVAQVKRRIAGCLRYPPRAARDHLEGTAVVRVQVAGDGRVLAAIILRTSGVADLDREAIAVWSRASPLPPPPMGGPTWQLLSVDFVLTQ